MISGAVRLITGEVTSLGVGVGGGVAGGCIGNGVGEMYGVGEIVVADLGALVGVGTGVGVADGQQAATLTHSRSGTTATAIDRPGCILGLLS